MSLKQAFWALANTVANPSTLFARVMWIVIAALLAVILFTLAMHAGQGVA